MEPIEKILLLDVFNYLKDAFELLNDENIQKTRASSLAMTKLEEAMMWLNKDRANKNYLTKSETHVQ